MKRVKETCPNNMTLSELIGTTRDQMQASFGHRWKIKFQSSHGLGCGFHTWTVNRAIYITVGSSAAMNGETPNEGLVIKHGSYESDEIKSYISFKLREATFFNDSQAKPALDVATTSPQPAIRS